MTDSQRRLADGIASAVSALANGVVHDFRRLYGDPYNPPQLSPLQSLALSVLVSQTAESGSMLIDALIEAGVIGSDWEAMVRADEREKCAGFVDSEASQWQGYDEESSFRLVHSVVTGIANDIRSGATS